MLDSVGFSRVAEAHGILHFLSRLVAMRDVVRPVLRQHGALSTKFEADNAFAVFDAPDEAIAASLAIHRAVDAHSLMLTESEPFRVCIGVGYGQMLYSETLEGYFGEEMNLASKLGEDTADGGETLVTDNAYRNASQDMVSAFEPREITVSRVDVRYWCARHPLDEQNSLAAR
ncbi:MAG: adenylate/guanylate cyclase domain-containing protein [Pseudomonadales bacterium]|nr:adenylate/guanylate cyclase domain-containing protein [Pseudomonadales bacterium]